MSETTTPLYKRVLDARVIGPASAIMFLATIPFSGIIIILTLSVFGYGMTAFWISTCMIGVFLVLILASIVRVKLLELEKKKI
jgi:hypothetical protein